MRVPLWQGQWDISRSFQTFQISRQIGSILVAILLAKSGLDLDDIGQYEQLLFLGYILTFFWLQGLIQGFVASYSKGDQKDDRQHIEQVAGGLLILIGGGLGIVSWLLAGPFSALFTGSVVRPDMWHLFALFFIPTQVSSLVEHVYLLREEKKGLFAWTLYTSLGMVIALILPVWWFGTLQAGIWGLIFYATLRMAWMVLLIRPKLLLGKSLHVLNEWGRLSIPLIGYAMAGGATVIVDGWIINHHYHDARVFAIFRYGARELPFSLALASGVGTAAIALLATNWSAGLIDLKIRVTRLCHILFPITLVCIATSHWWFTKIFSSDFAGSAHIFNIYLMILISRVIMTSPLLTAKRHTTAILTIGLLELLVNIILSLIFVQYWGIAGVAWATVIAYTFEKLANMYFIHRTYNLAPSSYVPTRLVIGYSALMILVYILVQTN